MRAAFVEEVQQYRFLSFDLENYMPDARRLSSIPVEDRRPEDGSRIMYAHFATYTGRAVIFDLEMLTGGPVLEEDPLMGVPDDFVEWILDPQIMIAGSNVKGDVDAAGLEGQNLRDMNKVFEYYMNEPIPQPLVRLGGRTKIGMGAQSFFSKGVNYKPMSRADFEKYYGPHHYIEHNRKKWPLWRNKFRLYKWRRDANGDLGPQGQFYQVHDAQVPGCTTAALFVLRVARGDYNDSPDLSEWRVLSELLSTSGPDDVLVLNAVQEEEDLWETSTDTIRVSSTSSTDPTTSGAQASLHINKRFKMSNGNIIFPSLLRHFKLPSAPTLRKTANCLTTTARRRPRSSAPASPKRALPSPTSTRTPTATTPTSRTLSSPRPASTAAAQDTPMRATKVSYSASIIWRTTPPPSSAPMRAALTPPATGLPPATTYTTGAASATTAATLRAKTAGLGPPASTTAPEMPLKPSLTRASSPAIVGGTSAGDSSATSKVPPFPTAISTATSSPSPSAPSTAPWGCIWGIPPPSTCVFLLTCRRRRSSTRAPAAPGDARVLVERIEVLVATGVEVAAVVVTKKNHRRMKTKKLSKKNEFQSIKTHRS